MTPIFLESFELFGRTPDQTFAQFLVEAGFTVGGAPLVALDRTGYARAADLTEGSIQVSVQSASPLVAFGFAARCGEPGPIWRVHDDLVLEFDEHPRLAGVAGGERVYPGRWYYYEVLIRKADNFVDLYVNNTLQASVIMPASLRFLTTYQVAFPQRGGLIVDDLYAAEEGRMGPISTTAHFTDAELPWIESQPNVELSSNVVGAVPGGDIVALGVTARARLTDLDAREVSVAAGDQRRPIPVGVEERYRTGLFTTRAGGQPWTPEDIESLPVGVTITN